MRFGFFSAAVAVSTLALRETALAVQVRHDLATAHQTHGHSFGDSFAQMDAKVNKSKIEELKGEIKSAKHQLFEAQSTRTELKELQDSLEKGQQDYEETITIIQERLEGYAHDL